MLKSHFIIAWRNLWKSRASSLINIAGLSSGMMCFIVILFYVKNELSFDGYHKNADRIYRVVKDFVNDDGSRVPDATTPPALAYALRHDLPEVANATRMFPSWGRQYLIHYGEKGFYETGLIRIDDGFFDVFDFPFVRGSKVNAFKGPQSIILTQTAAKKYFGDEDPIGKVLRINVNNGQDFAVTGVVKDVPQNSHFTFDFLVPFVSRNDSTLDKDWNWSGFYTYVRLRPNADGAAFATRLQPLFRKYRPESRDSYYAQPVTAIHLGSHLKWELDGNGDATYIGILMAIAIFVILIAGINYINLTTARSLKRAKEAGIRKVAGASRSLLVIQFLTESVCTALVSFFVAAAGVLLLLPFVNELTSRALPLFTPEQWATWLELIGITLFIGLAAGVWPALQFSISIALIIGFLTIYRQVGYITRNNPGFDKDNVLLIPNVRRTGLEGRGAPGSWLDDLGRIPAVTSVARADGTLAGQNATNGVSTRGKRNHISLNFIRIDHSFLPTLQIPLKEGRNFYDRSNADSSALILNETAVKQLGLQPPCLGQQLEWDDEAGKTHPVTVVGITNDFYFSSLHEPIKPFGFLSEENNGSTFYVKLHSQDLQRDLAAVERAWTSHNPDKPFEYTFLDERIAKLYQYDIKFKHLFSAMTALAVLIACLGLVGLSIFTTEARRKELGVRKVLGASAASLFTLLSKDFLWLVAIAFVVATPVAWWVMNRWLERFAYRISLGWETFAVAGSMAMLVTLATISFHTIKAALANPVGALRSE